MRYRFVHHVIVAPLIVVQRHFDASSRVHQSHALELELPRLGPLSRPGQNLYRTLQHKQQYLLVYITYIAFLLEFSWYTSLLSRLVT